LGQRVSYVTGDYSRGASGFWIEKRRIALPVQESTIAGNPKGTLMGIQAAAPMRTTTVPRPPNRSSSIG